MSDGTDQEDGRLSLPLPPGDAGGRPQCAARTPPWARDRVCIGGKGAAAPSGESVPCLRRGPRGLSGLRHEGPGVMATFRCRCPTRVRSQKSLAPGCGSVPPL